MRVGMKSAGLQHAAVRRPCIIYTRGEGACPSELPHSVIHK